MYYKSFTEHLKEQVESGRCIILEEFSNNTDSHVKAKLVPKDITLCPNCTSSNTIKFGLKHRVIKDDYLSNKITYIHLEYNRFKCKDCDKMFNDKIDFMSNTQSISFNLKMNILEDLKENVSFTTIANKRGVAIQTVINIFESYVSISRVPFGDVLCMDEFKNLKHSSGKYAFVMFDPNMHKVCDILESRKQEVIDSFLYSIDWAEKDKVRYVVTDMSESFRTIVKRHFKNAKHIVDTFHFARYVSEAFTSVRIRIQNSFNVNSKEYRVLKKNIDILNKYQMDLKDGIRYNSIKQRKTDIFTLLSDCLSVSNELEKAYNIVQGFMTKLRCLKYEEAAEWMDEWINTLNQCEIKEFHDLKGLFENWKDEIINSFIRFGEKKLHNGYIEGLNNKIKVIKRISFGYSNFTHFRNRLMYIINNDLVLKKVDTSLIRRKSKNK